MGTIVSVYLLQRLIAEGTLSAPILIQALMRGVENHCSLVEALVSSDVRNAYPIARCFVDDGEKADTSWRPDPRLILDLPPGLCERLLAFPFRERAGAVEIATVTPLERTVQEEFTFHLRRPVALFRANLQALLAAAGAPVDLGVLTHSLSEPPPRADTSPIPLVRKSSRKPPRPRTRTAPGIGEGGASSLPPSDPYASDPFQSSPFAAGKSPLQLLEEARDQVELTAALSGLLVEPFLILELGDDLLTPRVASSGAGLPTDPIERWQETVFSVAADEGKYMGPMSPSVIHDQFSFLFSQGDLVVAQRVGSIDSGLVVVQKVRFDGTDDGDVIALAQRSWDVIQERAQLFS